MHIFTRKDGAVEYSIAPSAEVNKMVLGWIEKNPFASLLTINNDMPVLADANIDIAQKWFDDELTIIGLHSFNPALIGIFRNDENINKFASELFKAIDLGIDGVKVETENFEDWISTHDVSNLPVDKLRKMHSGVLSEVVDFRNTRDISVEDGVQKISQMMFRQFGENGFSKEMDIQAQSDGTVRLLSLVPAFYAAMQSGKTVAIDELDHSIHPHLVFLRTDEAWMVEKKNGSSRMYSLNDFKIHNTINIENGYMEGRYGAIPFIGELNM